MDKERIIWIDRMKVIGMYFIIAGHLFPIGYTYIYAFSVPLFFLISGFLYKQEHSNYIFWKKIALNFIVPLFSIRTIMYFWEMYIYTESEHFLSISEYWLFMLKGYQNCLGACWFIYTLILIRIIYHYIPHTTTRITLFVFLSGIAIYTSVNNIHKSNAILNITVAYQPYIIGYLLNHYKTVLDNYKPSLSIIVLSIIVCTLLLILCGLFNGNVWLYNNGYGQSFILYLGGILIGTTMIYFLSKINGKYATNIITTLSAGNIITLGFHQFFINLIKMTLPFLPYLSYGLAILILLIFYPIIKFCQAYCPIIIGNYHPTK